MLGPFDEQCLPPKKIFQNSVFFFFLKKKKTLHIDTHPRRRQHIHAPQPHCLQIPSVDKQFACEMVRSADELFAIEKMAAQGTKEDQRGAWRASEDDTTVPAPGSLGVRHGFAQRWATTRRGVGLCGLSLHFRLTSFELRVVCGSGHDSAINSETFSCRLLASLQTLHAAQSPLFADVCRNLASSAAATASMSTWPRTTGNTFDSCVSGQASYGCLRKWQCLGRRVNACIAAKGRFFE